MIQSFIVWLLGPEIAIAVCIPMFFGVILSVALRCADGKWPWQKKD